MQKQGKSIFFNIIISKPTCSWHLFSALVILHYYKLSNIKFLLVYIDIARDTMRMVHVIQPTKENTDWFSKWSKFATNYCKQYFPNTDLMLVQQH